MFARCKSATTAGATHTYKHSHTHRVCSTYGANAMEANSDSAGRHADLLINLTNSTLIFADFVRHTQMNLICLKRTA